MTGFMGQNSDDFIGGFGLDDSSGIDEHALAIDNKSVEAVVFDQMDADIVWLEASRLENRAGIVLDQFFGFCIPDQLNAAPLGIGAGGGQEQGLQTNEQRHQCTSQLATNVR